MKSLITVAKLVSRQKLRKLDILTEDVLNAKTSKFKELYDALQNGTVRNDREAAQLLYDATPTDSRYRQLKSRFRKRLHNTLFFVDQNRPHQTSFEQTFHNCQRDWSLINILRSNNAISYAEQMAKTLLTCCLKYGFAELSVQVSRFLADCAASDGDQKMVTHYQTVIDTNRTILSTEMKGEELLRRLRLILKQKNDNPGIEIDAEVVVSLGDQLSVLRTHSSSTMVEYNALEGQSLVFRILGENENLVNIVEEVVLFSEQSPRQMQEQRLLKLRYLQIKAFIELGDHLRGMKAVDALDSLFKIGNEDWFELRMAHCCLLLAGNQIQPAIQVIDLVMKHRNFTRLGAPVREEWSILQAIAALYSGQPLSMTNGFDASAFTRKDPIFGGDHQRLNAWRLLVGIAILYKERKFSEIEPRLTKLRTIAVRKLDSKRDRRLIAFTQVLYRLEKKQFSHSLDRVAERYLGELLSIPFSASIQSNKFAPVPLEDILNTFGLEVEAAYA